ncbi:apolipoprotein Da, duplicate 2 [Oryzias melastigma]|uniref:Apolipoprotein D n=1 Tax=Oryzias melastigma TaxID=30732 RepID=A0A3B3DF20_ORYME|nr:apolipoprotein Da, duplicate 2 [Oryzias melastigma]
MRAAQVIPVTLLLAFAANAQVFKAGRCPTPAVQANFDASRYLGKWFEFSRLPTTFQEGQCSTAFYTLKAPGVIEVLNSELLDDGTVNSIVGTAKVKDPAEPAKLEVSFYEDTPPGPYWVLSTDYDGHSLVYGCTDYGLFHMELSWILSRERTLPKETVEELHAILSSIGVSVDKMLSTVQEEGYCHAMGQ